MKHFHVAGKARLSHVIALFFTLLQTSHVALAGLPGLSALTEPVFEALLHSPQGSNLARALFGRPNASFNPAGGSHEVIAALLQPRNHEVYLEVLERINRVEAQVSRATGLSREQAMREALESHFSLLESGVGQIHFRDLARASEVYTSVAARRAEFMMAGRRVAVTRPQTPGGATLAHATGVHRDAFEQFLRWEERAGIQRYGESTQFFPLQMSEAPLSQVQVEIAASGAGEVADLFLRNHSVLWPRHPFNQYIATAFRDSPVVETWAGRLTASRSMVVWDRRRGLAFSVKTGTNYPHRTELQQGKLKSEEDVENALLRSNYMARLDREQGGRPNDLIFLHEVMTMLVPARGASTGQTARGVVVRDLTPLLDGHYYLPAFSIQYVGRYIARTLGEDFATLWKQGYADLLGRSKARLLLYYGLQMETPNTQNMLIQLDRNLRPTGKLVFRDMSDSIAVTPLMEAMNQHEVLAEEARLHNKVDRSLRLMTSNSLWRLNEDPRLGVPQDVIEEWARAHDLGFIDEVLKLLELPAEHPLRAALRSQTTRTGEQGRGVSLLRDYLFSDEGLEAFKQFHLRLRGGAAR
jgi:hypothetical protein